MARNILKSNNSLVIAGQRSAFTTEDRTGEAMSGAYMSAVQEVSFGFSQDRQKSKQIGSQGLVINDINRSPDVSLNINYYYTPAMLNENLLGLADSNPSYDGTGFFNEYIDEDQNFYILNHPDQGSDLIVGDESQVSGLDDIETFCVGNAFLTNYSLGFSVGSLPIVSTSYKASNSTFVVGRVNSIENPAINLQSGNNINVGDVDLELAKINGFDFYSSVNRFNPPLCSHQHLDLTLENLQIGGAPIRGGNIQSFDFSIPIERTDLYGLGSNYPYGREIKYPIRASVSLDLLVSGFATGEISDIVSSESNYDFDVKILDSKNEFQNTFSFEGLRLENSSYSMQVNGNMSYSLAFSFEIQK